MAYKVAIDSNAGGEVFGNTSNGIIEKDYTLLISKYISDRLNDLKIENFLVRDSDVTLTDNQRANIIKNKYGNGNNIIVISNRLNKGGNSGTEIIYPLRNNSKLASIISNNIEQTGQNVNKYYQQRNSTNTALDDDYLIRNTPNNQTIVINYGYVDNINDANFIKNNYKTLGEAVVKSIAEYAGITYLPSNLEGYYTVQKGDSLWKIASKYNTTVDNLKKINNLSSNTLSIGQILKIPNLDDDSIKDNKNTYTVKKGDSLYSISKLYGISVNELKSANNLSSNNLFIGQVLIIPNQDENIANKITYTVQKGDSLWKIANKYNTTVDKIKSTNGLTSNLLNIGQTLIIPSTSSYITYTVQKGDSLWIIANKYNTTVDNLKKLNNLSSNLLQIDQKLIIET